MDHSSPEKLENRTELTDIVITSADVVQVYKHPIQSLQISLLKINTSSNTVNVQKISAGCISSQSPDSLLQLNIKKSQHLNEQKRPAHSLHVEIVVTDTE